MNNPTKIITHHAASLPHHTVEDVDRWHKARWPGFTSKIYTNSKGEFYHVGYHYVIEKNGDIIRTRGPLEEGAHTRGQNTSSVGVCLMGNFDNEYPTEEQKQSFVEVYKEIHREIPMIGPNDIYPHRRYATKSCHGKLLSDTYFTDLLVPEDKEIKQRLERIVQLYTKLYSLLLRKRQSHRQVVDNWLELS